MAVAGGGNGFTVAHIFLINALNTATPSLLFNTRKTRNHRHVPSQHSGPP